MFLEQLIDRTSALFAQHKDELVALDQAIGDGDHGINMQRGFDAILAEKESLAKESLGAALREAGKILVMRVGGASGPLYGSLLMEMGKNAPADETLTKEAFTAMCAAGVAAVRARGKAAEEQKTMLDVLIPSLRELEQQDELDLHRIRACVAESLEKTRAMKALKGRAAFLGERSIGHIDPGAKSSALLIETICELWARKVG